MAVDGFAELARSLNAFVDAGEVRTPQPFAPDSGAARECAGEAMADEWGQKPNEEAWFMAGLASGAGWDHLRALADLIDSGRVTQALGTVARGAMEAFALAYYVGDASVDARERVRRYMNLRLQDHNDQRHLLKVTAGGEMTASEREQQQQAEQLNTNFHHWIEASAERQGFKVTTPRNPWYPKFLGDDPVPSKTKLCEAVVGTSGGGLGTVQYKSLSATTHSAIQGLAHGLVEDPDGGGHRVRFGIHEANAATRYFGSLMAAMTVLLTVNPYRGWPTPQDAIDAVGFTWMGVGRVEVPDEVVVPEAFRRPGWGH